MINKKKSKVIGPFFDNETEFLFYDLIEDFIYSKTERFFSKLFITTEDRKSLISSFQSKTLKMWETEFHNSVRFNLKCDLAIYINKRNKNTIKYCLFPLSYNPSSLKDTVIASWGHFYKTVKEKFDSLQGNKILTLSYFLNETYAEERIELTEIINGNLFALFCFIFVSCVIVISSYMFTAHNKMSERKAFEDTNQTQTELVVTKQIEEGIIL